MFLPRVILNFLVPLSCYKYKTFAESLLAAVTPAFRREISNCASLHCVYHCKILKVQINTLTCSTYTYTNSLLPSLEINLFSPYRWERWVSLLLIHPGFRWFIPKGSCTNDHPFPLKADAPLPAFPAKHSTAFSGCFFPLQQKHYLDVRRISFLLR